MRVSAPRRRSTVPRVDALLAFAAALVSLRLSAELVAARSSAASAAFAAWAAALGAYARRRGRARLGRGGRVERGVRSASTTSAGRY